MGLRLTSCGQQRSGKQITENQKAWRGHHRRVDIARPNQPMSRPAIHRWIKTDCGRAKYAELATREDITAKLRLGWFVLIASLRDLPIKNQENA